MERVTARRQIGGVGGVGVPVIAARLAGLVRPEGDLRRLVAPDPWLRCPERKPPAAQVEIRHLLAATPYVLVGFGRDAKPEPVDCRVARHEGNGARRRIAR